ncbi:MAG: hypothetical protein OEM28_01235 [Nitrosopumilus sp.]|nr:hypothetical protein [Nitrosopumilus sp.]MDH3486490.1 hypothetical protein [Nitrosopumilus sp.]
MSTVQHIYKERQCEYRPNLVANPLVNKVQKLSLLEEVLEYSWEEFQGLSWIMKGDEFDFD